MNKKQKSSIILASLASIAVAGSVISGATYALFTSESKTNIAVTSGKVDVSASISDLVTYSGEADSLTGDVEKDASHIKSSEELGIDNLTFLNGGTASLSENVITLSKVTPGDKVTFKINVVNNSNVAIKYRTKVAKTKVSETEDSDETLYDALSYKIAESSDEMDTAWTALASGTEGENIAQFDCFIELPSNVKGSNYMDKSCAIAVSVEAIQANALTSNEGATYLIQSEDELKNCFASIKEGESIVLTNDISLTYKGSNAAGYYDTYITTPNVTLDLNGKTITVNSNVVKCLSAAASNITIKNGKIVAGADSSSTSGKISYPLQITSAAKNVLLENLEITGGVQVVGSSTVTIKDCKITATNYYDVYLEYKSAVTIESGEFNPADGKVHFYLSLSTDSITLNGGTFSDNTCYYSGNGTFTNNSSVTVTKK